MKKISRFRFQSLSNMEFTIVVPHIISIVEKYPVVPQYLRKRLDTLKVFIPDLDMIEAQSRKWRDAKLLDDCEHSRDTYVSTLIRTERTYSRVLIQGFEDASKKLTMLLDKHGRDITDDRNIAKTQRIYNLVEDIEKTPGMLDTLAVFSLIPVYNAMKEANIHFDELWIRRNKELSEIKYVDSRTIRRNCVIAIDSLYKGIEYWSSESDDIQWEQLISELSQLGDYYSQQIKSRTTRRKNKEDNGNEILTPPQI